MNLFSDMIPRGLDIRIQVFFEDTELLILSSSPSITPYWIAPDFGIALLRWNVGFQNFDTRCKPPLLRPLDVGATASTGIILVLRINTNS